MKPILSLPVNIDDLLHGKAVEWERLEFKEDHSYFQVRLPVHPQATQTATAQVTGQVQHLVETSEGEMCRNELQERLGLRHRENSRTAYVQPALETSLVEMAHPDTPRSGKQKYRLTAKGRAWLAEQRGRGGAA